MRSGVKMRICEYLNHSLWEMVRLMILVKNSPRFSILYPPPHPLLVHNELHDIAWTAWSLANDLIDSCSPHSWCIRYCQTVLCVLGWSDLVPFAIFSKNHRDLKKSFFSSENLQIPFNYFKEQSQQTKFEKKKKSWPPKWSNWFLTWSKDKQFFWVSLHF